MNFHAVMPFYRQYLVPELIAHFEAMSLIWHPVCDYADIIPFQHSENQREWIQPVLCKPLLPSDQCYRKNNDFIETGNIIDEDYYGFIHDDDMYIPGFITKIKQQTAKIIFYSMSRGDVCPDDNHPWKWPPIPIILNTSADIHVAGIDMCQYIVKGEILKQTRFGNASVCDDGFYAENLKNRWPADYIIMPEIGINFNYLQKGRYLNK
jgi:hypothetical protein